MPDINFEQVVFIQQNKNEIDKAVEEFKRVACKVCSNTLLQLTHFELIDRYFDLSDFLVSGDINATVLKKMSELIEETNYILQGDEYQSFKTIALKAAETMKILKQKGIL